MHSVLSMSPAGHLQITAIKHGTAPLFQVPKHIAEAFEINQSMGLLTLAGADKTEGWQSCLTYWREFATHYLHQLCRKNPLATKEIGPLQAPSQQDLENMLLGLPPMLGAEYCTTAAVNNIWDEFDKWLRSKVVSLEGGLREFIATYLPDWHQVGRVCFHLAENKAEPEYPFAFLATYAPRLKESSRTQYQPLSQALQEYAGTEKNEALWQLLKPISDAAKSCQWVKTLVDSGDIYHPFVMSPQEAHQVLRSVPQLEESGILVRLPDWWKKRPRPKVQVSIGNKQQKSLSVDTLLDFQVDVVIEGSRLTQEELEEIFSADTGLISLRGQWIEVDREKLAEALTHWQQVQTDVAENGLSFIEGMRLLAGVHTDLADSDEFGEENNNWAFVDAGSWLKEKLYCLRQPEALDSVQAAKLINANLRPYQMVGVNWLHFLTELGLGACLADDMGLGKTIQVIALLAVKYRQSTKLLHPSILVLPASLLSNWKSELERFAPSLKALYLHASEMARDDLKKLMIKPAAYLKDYDLVLTTYGTLLRQPWLQEQLWQLAILDEAQAVKNPTAQQTKAVKALKCQARIALTGTPVENQLGDLWSLFDFLCPGLLGSASRFKNFVKLLEKRESKQFAPLRKLVQPYILRRLKTDKHVINDLPDKTEVISWCGLSKEQVRQYTTTIKQLEQSLAAESGIKRRGLVLSYLMRLKQICNHPSLTLGIQRYQPEGSGKFLRLRELCEEIAARQEKVLIFTQFREMTDPLASFLEEIFGRSGLVLHGGTVVGKRKQLVDQFQQELGPPFFVLSLKAGGTGLNLTSASHVIHFDRWWNPAVENQATDRAYRIGQKKNVLVHKFVCRGTIEEKIAELISEKTALFNDLLNKNGEAKLTELDDNALIELVSLDLDRAKF